MYNVVNNPIPRSGLWATPTLEQIQTQIEGFPPEIRAQMHHVMMYERMYVRMYVMMCM